MVKHAFLSPQPLYSRSHPKAKTIVTADGLPNTALIAFMFDIFEGGRYCGFDRLDPNLHRFHLIIHIAIIQFRMNLKLVNIKK